MEIVSKKKVSKFSVLGMEAEDAARGLCGIEEAPFQPCNTIAGK